MNVTVIGSGYVGLVAAVGFAVRGHDVECIEANTDRLDGLQRGVCPIHEAKLPELMRECMEDGSLTFLRKFDIKRETDIYVVAVGTPSSLDGSCLLSQVNSVFEDLHNTVAKDNCITVVVKSTVPPGTCRALANQYRTMQVIHNPEFLREGSAYDDFMRPERIIIGTDDHDSAGDRPGIQAAAALYRRWGANSGPVLYMDTVSAELTKYASNCMLASRISFMNEFANIAEVAGANIDSVRVGMGMDSRIGQQFLRAGPGYGGSCFPKDVAAMRYFAKPWIATPMLDAIASTNSDRIEDLAERISSRFGTTSMPTVAILGLTFKPDTDDMRDSPGVRLAWALQKRRVKVMLHDPLISTMKNDGMMTSLDELNQADAVVIMTEWQQYKDIPLVDLVAKMKGKHVFDYRNIYPLPDHDNPKLLGVYYYSIGRPTIITNNEPRESLNERTNTES